MENEEGILATLFAPRGGLFFGAFLRPKFPKPPKIDVNMVRGVVRGDGKFWTEKKAGKHYENRGFRTVLRSEWAKRAKLKLDKKKEICTKKAPSKTTSDSSTLCMMVFSCFWGIPESRPEKARKHYKISGFGEISVTVSKGVFGTNGWGGNLVPGPGGSGSVKPLRFRNSNFQFLP